MADIPPDMVPRPLGPQAMTLASLARAGLLDPDADSETLVAQMYQQPMPPTLSGMENQPPPQPQGQPGFSLGALLRGLVNSPANVPLPPTAPPAPTTPPAMSGTAPTMAQMLRAGAGAGPPPTLAGPAPPPRNQAEAFVENTPGGALGIDWGSPRPGMPPLTASVPPELQSNYNRPGLRPTAGAAMTPQSIRESEDQDAQMRALGFLVEQGAPFAVGGPVARGVQAAGQGVGAVGRTLAASPAGQWVGRVASRNPLLTGGTVAGGVTLATPGQTADTPRLQLRAPDARKELQDAQSAAAAFDKEERTKLQTNIDRFDPERFNWRNAEAVGEAQDLLQRLGIKGLDPRTNQMVLPPSDRRDGPITRAAVAEYRRQQQEALKAREATIADRVSKARDALTGAEKLDQRETSARRMQELDQPTLVEQVGPYAGYVAGALKGGADRYLLGRAFRGLAQTRADRANGLMADMGQGSANERVGRLNQFWTEGGSRNPPYTYTPGARPYPWSAAPDAAPPSLSSLLNPRDPAATSNASRLYRPSALEQYGPAAGVGGFGALEWHFGEGMIADAERELAAAQTAIAGKEAPTEAELQRLRDARQGVAWGKFTRNVGRGELGGGAMTDLHMRAHAPARPQFGRAEAERGAIDLMLNPPPAPPPPGPPPPAPVWDDRIGRWRLNGGFVSNGPAPLPAPRGRR